MHMVAVTAGPGHYHYKHMASTIPKASVQILFVRLKPMELYSVCLEGSLSGTRGHAFEPSLSAVAPPLPSQRFISTAHVQYQDEPSN